MGADRAVSGLRFLQEEVDTQPVWGDGGRVLWASGEGLMIVGPQGTGKSTLAQQLCLARMGLGRSTLLGFPVVGDDRAILYLAMDRPPQIRRSFARMVNLDEQATRAALDDQLTVWHGPTPVKANESPDAFCEWVRRRGREPGLVVADSLKDLVSGLTDDADGIGFNDAMQRVLETLGCEFLTLHHQRKPTVGNAKPNKLGDVYGNTWLTAGQGSVILLWGQPGDASVELSHLKQPQEKVGPLTVNHTHLAGASSVVDVPGRVLSLAMGWDGWFTARDIGPKVFDLDPNEDLADAQRSKLKRELTKLSDPIHGVLEQKTGTAGGVRGGTTGTQWRAK